MLYKCFGYNLSICFVFGGEWCIGFVRIFFSSGICMDKEGGMVFDVEVGEIEDDVVWEVVEVDVVVKEGLVSVDYFDVVEFFFCYGFEYGNFCFDVFEIVFGGFIWVYVVELYIVSIFVCL